MYFVSTYIYTYDICDYHRSHSWMHLMNTYVVHCIMRIQEARARVYFFQGFKQKSTDSTQSLLLYNPPTTISTLMIFIPYCNKWWLIESLVKYELTTNENWIPHQYLDTCMQVSVICLSSFPTCQTTKLSGHLTSYPTHLSGHQFCCKTYMCGHWSKCQAVDRCLWWLLSCPWWQDKL